MENNSEHAPFIDQSETQMRKGMLVYCVLLLCSKGKVYTSDIIRRLHDAELIVVEGTLYPLLNRLARDKLLGYEWRESEQGPPRKYYWLTDEGKIVLASLSQTYERLHASIKSLEKGVS
ncbi:MAG TPA: PadR family transcriptional regulator [Candidatus Saccharimonadales bacterium]|nr:PadR family transcriptional regulator [Candidatus Saccharimonadales bacterium]